MFEDVLGDAVVEVRLPKATWELVLEATDHGPYADAHDDLLDALRASALRQVGKIDQMQGEFQKGEEA